MLDMVAGVLPRVRHSLASPVVPEQPNQQGQAVFLISSVFLLQCC